jgi:hypothetical protein
MSDVGSQLMGGRSVRAFARLGFRGHGFGVFRFVWQTQFLAPHHVAASSLLDLYVDALPWLTLYPPHLSRTIMYREGSS